MESDFCKIDPFDFEPLHEFARKMQTGCRSGNCAFVFRIYCLIAIFVIFNHRAVDQFRKRWFAHVFKQVLEFIVFHIGQEPECTSPGSGIVNHFGYEFVVFAEVEFVADSDFACGVNQYIPEFGFCIELAE